MWIITRFGFYSLREMRYSRCIACLPQTDFVWKEDTAMPLLQADELTRLIEGIYAAAGAPPDIARTVAESLVKTNLLGHDSHGVIRTKMYVSKIRDGSLQPAARPELAQRSGSTAIIDCHWGFGQVGARYGAQVAADIARETGMAGVALSQV